MDATHWEKIFSNPISDKTLVSRICKHIKTSKLNNKKTAK